ncbi:MAG: cupin domain-containing protein [Pseudomonadota bacterium]
MSEKLASKRHVFNIKDAPWRVYTLQGKPQKDCHWANLSYDDKSGEGCFLFRFGAGAHSIPHEHLGFEEFYVLEGEIEDNDGYVYHPGDFVSLDPGSRHSSHSDDGAIVAVFVRGGFRTLEWAKLDD